MAFLSKIKVGNDVYQLKDADARAILATLKSAAFLDADTSITDDATGVAKTAAIKKYVDDAVAVGIQIVMAEPYVDPHTGDVTPGKTNSSSGLVEPIKPSDDTMGKLYLVKSPEAPVDSDADGGDPSDYYYEFITVKEKEDGEDVWYWEKIGDTRVDLSDYYTKSEADAKFVQIANLGDLAYADTATGTATIAATATSTFTGTEATITITVPEETFLTGAYAHTKDVYVANTTNTVVPSYAANLNTEAMTLSVTGGTVTAGSAASIESGFFNAGALPTKENDTFSANVPTTIDTSKFSGGSKAADTFDAGSLPTKAADTFTAGDLPSLGTQATAAFATGGIVAEVGTGEDDETLIFTAATTASAVTPGLYTNFSAGTAASFTEGAFTQGSLPSFTEGAYTPAEIQSGFYTAGTAASFTEGAFNAGSLPSIDDTKFDGGAPTQVTLPDTATIAAQSVVTGITGATAFTVVTEASLAINSDSGVTMGLDLVDNISTSAISATISTTYTPAGTISTTVTGSVTVTVSPDGE